jgi:phosphoribosyl-ATP pyrophosphohydrolase
VVPGPAVGGVLAHLWTVIQDRKTNPLRESYTCRLFDGGLPYISKKVGEEAVEVIVAAQSEGDERLVSELADLTYHALVLLAARDLTWGDVEAELAGRFGTRRSE